MSNQVDSKFEGSKHPFDVEFIRHNSHSCHSTDLCGAEIDISALHLTISGHTPARGLIFAI